MNRVIKTFLAFSFGTVFLGLSSVASASVVTLDLHHGFLNYNTVTGTYFGAEPRAGYLYSPEEIAAVDAFGPFDLVAGFGYDLTIDDPTPSVAKNWMFDYWIDLWITVPGEGPGDQQIGAADPYNITYHETFHGWEDAGYFSLEELAYYLELVLGGCIGGAVFPGDPVSPNAACFLDESRFAAAIVDFGSLPMDGFIGELVYFIGGLGLPPAAYIAFEGQLQLKMIPAPASLALLGFGLVGMGIARRRRTK